MRFNKVLHPEMLLGKKKVKSSEMREFLQKISKLTGNEDVCKKEHEFSRHLLILRSYQLKNDGIYYIPSNFLDALLTVDKNIPIKLLPDRFHAYFVFPDNKIAIDGRFFEGAYFYISQEIDGSKAIIITFISNEYMAQTTLALRDNLTFWDNMLLDVNAYGKDPRTDEKRKDLFCTIKLLVNSVIYIHSKDPEIDLLKPIVKMTPHERRVYQIKDLLNETSLPIKLLNWSFHGRTFNVDSTTVMGHFRWQPCGMGRQEVKLIWIDEHERKYNNVIDVSEEDMVG